ncbi:NACHT, LRR and PYD domains-containing protein 3-like [Aquarana catesbeiana]|uniref:NACHT, LRR and PYD domains-containing protein 3-like n=1 Tax=Aquarana catesbeiana TaxID=8400 RepID=UPI003CC9B67F
MPSRKKDQIASTDTDGSGEVREKIWKGDYVETFSLLPLEKFNLDKVKPDESKKEEEEKLSYRLIPRTFPNWLQAFNILATVIGEKASENCSALFCYLDFISEAQRVYGGLERPLRRRIGVSAIRYFNVLVVGNLTDFGYMYALISFEAGPMCLMWILGHSYVHWGARRADIQEKHKHHLMKKTETLLEHRPPGSTLEPQRFLINERYVNLIVVSTDQFRQRSQNELIQTGLKHEECLKKTQIGLEHISPNKLFRWNQHFQCVPHAVMVSGVPGIGKTTMMQKFVYDWVTGKHYKRFAFVFFFKFRDLNRMEKVNLEEMILHQYPYLEGHIGNILQYPERLLFIFDGLDESIHQMDFKSSRLFANKTISGEIVVSLVRQSLLKGCSVLITSRPTRLASVDTGVFQRITEIMGFLHGHRLTFFNNFFGNGELSEKAFYHVQENDTLYTFCYIPSYCWIICTVLSMCFRAQPTITDQLMTSLPKTVTQLFVTFVSNILANHCQNKDGDHTVQELLTSIGWMAEHGVMSHMIVFDDRHLESFSVKNDKHLFSCFMMESGQPPNADYAFFHLTLQEFFAALVHFISYNPDRLRKTLDKAESHKDGRAEILLRFLCGLSDTSTRSMLKSHVGELSSDAAKHVITWIRKKIAEIVPYKSQAVNRELLNIFYYLHESRNKALVSQCIGSNKVVFSKVPLSPLDCSVLSFILQSLKETEDVNLSSCDIQDEGLKKLIPALHNIKSLR